jgi:hypothetical protein
MGVIAAKLKDGKEAVQWAKNFLRPGVALFDDTCFGEIVADFEDFKKTPEVAAHGAFICNLTQMLLGPDDEKEITLFPAIPIEWEKKGVSFQKLAAKGGVLVSGEFEVDRVQVTLENCLNESCSRDLRVRLPEGTTRLRDSESRVRIEAGWARLSDVQLPAKSRKTLDFVVMPRNENPAGPSRK